MSPQLVFLSMVLIAHGDDPGEVAIAAPGAKLEKLWDQGEFTEGGALDRDGSILFSDIGDRIMRFDPASGKVTVDRAPSGRANGLIFGPEGRLIAAEGASPGGGRRVSITEPGGRVRTLADGYRGHRFNSPNDLAIDARGRVYVSDPRYGGDEPRELPDESVYRIDPDGSVNRLETTAKKPNGLAVAPDQKTLYVADSGPDRQALLALDLDPASGTVSRPRVLHNFGKGRGIDGLTVTSDGRIVGAAGSGKAGGVYLFAANGKVRGFLHVPEDPTNVEFGGPDRQMLYITAGKSLYRVKTILTGHHLWPPRP